MNEHDTVEHITSAAAVAAESSGASGSVADALQSYVWGHIADGYHWHLPIGDGVHLPSSIYFSVHTLMLIIASVFLIVVICFLAKHTPRVPSKITSLVEVFIIFIRDEIAIPSMGESDGKQMTPLLGSFFFFILCLNLMGLIPIFATATANLGVTAGLALIVFVMMIGGGLVKNGVGGLFHAFVPTGVPIPVLILLVPLEMIGVLIKTFALTIRLFANLLAGHIVVFFLIGLMILFGAWGLPAIGMAVFILFIEILVAFLQAYVFTLLSAVFMGQIYHPAH